VQLARQRHDHDASVAAAGGLGPLVKLQRQSGLRLVSQPRPTELDHRCTNPSIPGFRDALLTSDGSALPGRWNQTGIGGQLPSVGEVPEESFRPMDHGELGTGPPQGLQDHRLRLRRLGP
jgi:hypothetical protein